MSRAFERTIWQSRKNWRDSWRRVAARVFDEPTRATLEGAEMLSGTGQGQKLTPGDRQHLIRSIGLRAVAEFGLKDGKGGKISAPVQKYVGTFSRANPRVSLVPGQLLRAGGGLDRHGNIKRNLRNKILGWFFNPAGGEEFVVRGTLCNARNLRVYGDGVDPGGPRTEKERADFEFAGFGKPSPPAPGQSRWLVLMPGDPLGPGSRRKRRANVTDRSIPIATLRGRISRPASHDRILTAAWRSAMKQTEKDFRKNIGGAVGRFEPVDRGGARFI